MGYKSKYFILMAILAGSILSNTAAAQLTPMEWEDCRKEVKSQWQVKDVVSTASTGHNHSPGDIQQLLTPGLRFDFTWHGRIDVDSNSSQNGTQIKEIWRNASLAKCKVENSVEIEGQLYKRIEVALFARLTGTGQPLHDHDILFDYYFAKNGDAKCFLVEVVGTGPSETSTPSRRAVANTSPSKPTVCEKMFNGTLNGPVRVFYHNGRAHG